MSHTQAPSVNREPRSDSTLRYPAHLDKGRDARLDFIRGFACVSFVTSHFEAFTWLQFLFWERLGIVTGAELFVIVSGVLVGRTARREEWHDGFTVARRWWRRAGTLYLAYVALIALVILLARFTALDVQAVTTFTDRWANVTYPLIPPEGTPLLEQIKLVLLLRVTPHQVQILGFYVCVLVLACLALLLLRRRRGWLCILVSLAVWAASWLSPVPLRPTGAQFEYAFPLMAWQVLFFCPLVAGYRLEEVKAWIGKHRVLSGILFAVIAAIALASLIYAQTTDNPSFPSSTRLSIIDPQTFRTIYDTWFTKDSLGPGRIVTSFAFIITFYVLLTYLWKPLAALLGWLLLPLGRASLYVFLVHVPFILAADQIPGYFEGVPTFDWATIWWNTGILVGILVSIWSMIRFRVLFGIVPR
ncbi:MAG TPA: OpgC domain-containing protein [Allosphingosinicella sp.]|nr:OpgC domain-containing protein [Allosphingosinicella sp.]